MENQPAIFEDLNFSTVNTLSKGTRLGSMFLDHVIMCFVFFAFSIPSFIESFREPSSQFVHKGLFNFPTLLLLLGLAIYLCKDCIGGQSVAKRILGLQIVDSKTGEVASPLKCFIRNIFCLVWPAEVIITLINPSRRLGDRVAGTKVVLASKSIVKPSINYFQLVACVMLSYLLIILICFPFNNMF